jgi:hypothetical protein
MAHLHRVYVFAALSAVAQLSLRFRHAGLVFALVVERRNDHVAPLVPFGVVPIVLHDEATEAVIVGIHLSHDRRIRATVDCRSP